MSELRDDILQTILSLQSQKRGITVIGIDGPTASGKTTFADELDGLLQAQGIHTWVYRVDWTLVSRSQRLQDLAQLRLSEAGFPFEAELHMRMDSLKQFLIKIRAFNEAVPQPSLPMSLTLDQLYNREDEGKMTGVQSLTLRPGMVILVEGHYTLRSDLDALIDYNILLLADFEALLQRKKNRVKDYRSFAETEDYFWRIDIPSFQHHLKRFGCYADQVINTTQFDALAVLNPDEVLAWTICHTQQLEAPVLDSNQFAQTFFAHSSFVSDPVNQALEAGLAMIQAWDKQVGQYLRASIHELEQDIQSWFDAEIKTLNHRFSSQGITFDVSYSDALYNVYYRKQPLSMGLSLIKDGLRYIAFTADIFQETLRIYVVWEGGYKRVEYQRMLGDISSSSPTFSEKISVFKAVTPLTVFTPTDFMLPSFLEGVLYNPVFIGREGENMTTSQIMDHLLTHGGVWIHRFSLFSEIRFFEFILTHAGFLTVQIGNYLIGFLSDQPQFIQTFIAFSEPWQKKFVSQGLIKSGEDQLDDLVKAERLDMAEIVRTKSTHFTLKEGVLFSQFMYQNEMDIQEALAELTLFLSSTNRLLRKRATQFIFRYFPDLTLHSQDVWTDLPSKAQGSLLLEDFILLGPTILAEVYLWLGIRNQPSAILATNVYDIGLSSLDARSYLQTAADHHTPIVLQNSLNATGQKENLKTGEIAWGYLCPEKGPEDFIEASVRAARDLFLTTGKRPPLYSLGLDHVNVENDNPQGRAKRFFEKALDTGYLTHVVLDGSALFKADSRQDMAKAYEKVAEFESDLVENAEQACLIDREVCAGELSFVGDTPIIPTPEELQAFVRCYQQHLKKKNHQLLLARPMLFVGNLGTTHHGADMMPPQPELSRAWRDVLKSDNFISAVLHGTTHTKREVLKNASVGCHKINVAGDLLHALVGALPTALSEKILNSGQDPKRCLAAYRSQINQLSPEEQAPVIDALQALCLDLMTAINSPCLTQSDQDFFRYNTYNYSDHVVSLVVQAVSDRVRPLRTQPVQTLKKAAFAASMIEVPIEEMKPIIQDLWDQGLRHFHIDEGDGRFITRQFSGVDKAVMLRQKFPDACLHAHLMVQDPHLAVSGKSILDQYIDAGCSGISLHPRSFTKPSDVKKALKKIRDAGIRPGIVIETHDSIQGTLKQLILEAQLDWVVIMGVPIGYGGQIFQFSTLHRIAQLKVLASQMPGPFLIEVDGGLTLENLVLCRQAGGELFAGWSLIKPDSKQNLAQKLSKVQAILEA